MMDNSDQWDVAPPLPSPVRNTEDVYKKLDEIYNFIVSPRNVYSGRVVSLSATSVKLIDVRKIFDSIVFTTPSTNVGNVYISGPNDDPIDGFVLEPDERVKFEQVRGHFVVYFTNASDALTWIGFSLE